jgi:hypothetical protein
MEKIRWKEAKLLQNIIMRRIVPLVSFLSALLTTTVFGGIGETAVQLANRYGSPKDTQLTQITDKSSPLVEGGLHHTYEFSGWKIRAAFLRVDGPAVRMTYQKAGAQATTGVTVRDDELQAIAAANTPSGMAWKQSAAEIAGSKNTGITKMLEKMILSASGGKLWVRTDGAKLTVQSGIVVQLEMPEAREYEANLTAAKEAKAKASVPKF